MTKLKISREGFREEMEGKLVNGEVGGAEGWNVWIWSWLMGL